MTTAASDVFNNDSQDNRSDMGARSVDTSRLQFPEHSGGSKVPTVNGGSNGMEAVDNGLKGLTEAVGGGDCTRRHKNQDVNLAKPQLWMAIDDARS